MHAHDFRDAVEFRGKDVLIIGSSCECCVFLHCKETIINWYELRNVFCTRPECMHTTPHHTDSAEDISSQLYKYGVNHVTLCYRSAPMPFSWPVRNLTTES